MVNAIFLAVALGQAPAVEQDLLQPVSANFTVPIKPDNEQRLALTPVLDGKIEPEEWDSFAKTGDLSSWFQWEPGKLHGAATLPVGQDLIASFDLKGDGWLIGIDNLEVRLTWDGTTVKPRIRLLDATHPEGPEWVDAPELVPCLKTAAAADPATWSVEFSLADWGLESLPDERGHKMGVRFDPSSVTEQDYAPYLPRLVVPVSLVMSRTSFEPEGLKFKPEFQGRNVLPGQDIRIRFTYQGNNEMGLRRIEMRTEGVAEESTSLQAEPFPAFDRKGRAFADYRTRVVADAVPGYRIARATLSRDDGEPVICQTSYRIAPMVDFDVNKPKGLVSKEEDQKLRLSLYIRSNVRGRVDGVFDVVPPEGWSVETGVGKSFIIPNTRGSVRKAFDVIVPAGVRGVFPVRLRAEFGQKDAVEQVAWITVL